LAHLAEALDALGFLFGAAEHRQKDGGENANNGDHNQKFDQRKRHALVMPVGRIPR
jgi:hypothetical protein